MMYVGITSVVLIFLNLYAATTMRNLVFRSKRASLEDKVQMAASAFSGLQMIQEESAEKIMDQLGNLNATRVLVTDESGLVFYDSLGEDSAVGQYAVLPEIVLALGGNDVFYSSYWGGRLESKAATPILYTGGLIGAVYMMEYDLDQGALIAALQQNIFWISVVLEGAVILFSLFFSQAFSRRMRRILHPSASSGRATTPIRCSCGAMTSWQCSPVSSMRLQSGSRPRSSAGGSLSQMLLMNLRPR